MERLCFMSGLNSQEWAAWIEAAGTILAVLAAFFISRGQFQNAIRLQKEAEVAERRRRYDALLGFIGYAVDEFHGVASALEGAAPEEFFASNSAHELMDECLAALRQVSPLEMPSGVGARALVSLRDKIGAAIWNAKAPFDRDSTHHEDYAACASLLRDNIREIEEQKAILERELSVQAG